MANNRNRNRNRKKPVQEDNYIPPFPANVLAMPIEQLNLREATYELVKGAGFVTILDIVKKQENDFYRIIRFNKKNLIDLKYHLNGMKLHLKPQEEPKQAEEGGSEGGGAPIADERRRPNAGVQAAGRVDNNPRQANDNRRGDARAKAPNANAQQQRDRTARGGQNNDRNRLNDNVSEKRTKELREKMRPQKSVPQPVQDIYVKVNKGGKWGFNDRKGNVVVEPIYDEIFSFKEDLCCVELAERAGYINRQGEVIIELQYECGNSFSEGLACVFKGGKCGYIDKDNQTVVEFLYDAGTAFEDGACRIKKDGKWGELYFVTLEDGQKKQEIRWII